MDEASRLIGMLITGPALGSNDGEKVSIYGQPSSEYITLSIHIFLINLSVPGIKRFVVSTAW